MQVFLVHGVEKNVGGELIEFLLGLVIAPLPGARQVGFGNQQHQFAHAVAHSDQFGFNFPFGGGRVELLAGKDDVSRGHFAKFVFEHLGAEFFEAARKRRAAAIGVSKDHSPLLAKRPQRVDIRR